MSNQTLRFPLNHRNNMHEFVQRMSAEDVLKMVREFTPPEVFYFGTPLAKVVGFGIQQHEGQKFVYMEVEVTNDRNWERFEFRPNLRTTTSRDEDNNVTVEELKFSLGIKEKVEPFQES